VIHRDIKPGNIIVDANNRVRVVDFGIASHKFKPGSTRAVGQQISTALGTPGYAPQEQFTGQETPLSDLYALGATMHHLLTGRDPTKIQPLWQYPPVRVLNPKVSEATEDIVARALQNDPRKRYQSAAQMKRDVDRVLNPPGALSTFRGRAIAVLVVLLLLVGVGGGAFIYERQQALLPATGFVSDGNIAFDLQTAGREQTARDPQSWRTVKRQAAIDWKNGNTDQGAAKYGQATNNDQTDAESWIYQENHRAQTAGVAPYYVAVGGSFSGRDVSTGRQILQGAYTAQKEINDRGGIDGHLIALVLADDASTSDGALQSARKVVARGDVLALVGYRSSSRTALAQPVLANAKIPLVTPTASNPNLNTSPYFFRVCPSDTYQGTQAAQYMLHTLLKGKANPRIAVFADPNDRYSSGLSGIVSAVAQSGGARIVPETYTTGVTTDFRAQARDVVRKRVDLIYFAGLAHEALLFARDLDASGAPADLRIMSDDGFYNPSEFVALPGHKSRFVFTGFFYPDQVGLVRDPAARRVIQDMEARYRTNFHRADLPLGRYGSDRVPAGTALSYDALHVIAAALRAVGPNPRPQGVRDALAAIGTTAPAYQGATGRIAFDANGDPVNKALLVMHLDASGRTHMDRFLGTFR
jgi:ABC-type branched-subunit amino acid transport system substrate-binding protein